MCVCMTSMGPRAFRHPQRQLPTAFAPGQSTESQLLGAACYTLAHLRCKQRAQDARQGGETLSGGSAHCRHRTTRVASCLQHPRDLPPADPHPLHTCLYAHANACTQATLVAELLRDDSKKLRSCGTPLLAELVASLAHTLPFHAHTTPSLSGTLPTPLPHYLPPNSSTPARALPSSLASPAFATSGLTHRVSTPDRHLGPCPLPQTPCGLDEVPSPFEPPPPLPSARVLAVQKHARTRPGLQELVPIRPGPRGGSIGEW